MISYNLLVIGPSISCDFIKNCNWLNMIEILFFIQTLYIIVL